jgi:hypothetical protein
MAQVVKHLPSKREALSSRPKTAKKKKKKKKKENPGLKFCLCDPLAIRIWGSNLLSLILWVFIHKI